MSNREHRDSILARRALFLSTALSALGCPASPSSPDETTESTTASTTRKPRRKAKPQIKPNTPWAEVMAKAPARDVPAGLSTRETQQLTYARTNLMAKYATIEAVWVQTPGCQPGAPACADWTAVAEAAKKMYRALESHFVGGCGGAVGQTGSIALRSEAHQAYMSALVGRLEAHFEKVALHFGASGVDGWSRLLAEAKKPAPLPCLSPCAMPVMNDILNVVTFAKDDATINPTDPKVRTALMTVLATQQRQATAAALSIRGHADASERDPAELAKKRAQAVKKWLDDNGLGELTVIGLATTYPIDASHGGAANRRVDFEVVPR